MTKTKYIYKHTIYQGGPNAFNSSESILFFQESGIKLHGSVKDDYFYSWEFAGDKCSWFTFSHTEEVTINNKVKKLNSVINLRKPKTRKTTTRLPINPRTRLRDGGV